MSSQQWRSTRRLLVEATGFAVTFTTFVWYAGILTAGLPVSWMVDVMVRLPT